VIEIVFGLLLAFAGGKSIVNSVKFMIFLIASFSMLAILYNTRLFYMGLSEGKTWIIVTFAVCCFLVGLIAVCIFGKFVTNYFMQFLGFTLGSMTAVLFLYPIELIIYAKIAIAFVAGVIGFVVFHWAKTQLILVTTALIGSVMFWHGISQFTGKTFNSNDIENNSVFSKPLFYVFCVGALLMTVGGYIVQMKWIKPSDLPKDDFRR